MPNSIACRLADPSVSRSHAFCDLLWDHPSRAEGARVALFGAGGKSSLLYRLGHELAGHHARVLLSSLTKAVPPDSIPMWVLENVEPSAELPFSTDCRLLNLLRRGDTPGKSAGLEPAQLQAATTLADVCLFENDGAAKHPLKVHREPDPRVPRWATHAVILVGAEVLETRIDEGFVHRAEAFCAHWGWNAEVILTESHLVEVLHGPRGYRSCLPDGLEPVYLVNKADRWPDKASRLARALASAGAGKVHLGSVEEGWHERV